MELRAAEAKEMRGSRATTESPVQIAAKTLISDICGKIYTVSCDGGSKYDDLISSTLNNESVSLCAEEIFEVCKLTNKKLVELGYVVNELDHVNEALIKFDKFTPEVAQRTTNHIYMYCFHIDIEWI